MRPVVRLTRRPGGGFQLDGVAATPVAGVPDASGFVLTGAGSRRLTWSPAERGWILTTQGAGPVEELGRTSAAEAEPVLAPSSVLLADGRLFRLTWAGASEPRVVLGRWDVPGAYVVGRPVAGGWELTRTAAGESLPDPIELWILASVEIGRLDGWC